ncbi:MAG: N-acetylmuramoyl-L-alanine amidase [Gemmatimonadetes bacterium]|nr:N-acetylmuramoyl-L-alanine amidase [Gemmatimonadota bacterium]
MVPIIAPPLPAIPRVTGPLALRVTYPQPNQQLTARDSNFIFGSVGSGDAQLTINDVPVKVEPNGAFIGWLTVPPGTPARTGNPTASYRLVAVNGADTARLTLPVRVPAPRVELSNAGKLEIDAGSASPKGTMQLPAHEAVTVRVRAPTNATVFVRDSAGTVFPLVNGARLGQLRGIIGFDSTGWGGDVPARALASPKARLVVTRDRDSVTVPLATVKILPDDDLQLGALKAAPGIGGDTDAAVVVRPTAGGTYRWMMFPGTTVPITGRIGTSVRVRLDKQLDAWVEDGDITPLPSGTAAPKRTTGTIRVRESSEWTDVIVQVIDRPPYHVSEDGRQLVLTLYATTGASENVIVPSGDPLVKSVRYDQPMSDRTRIVVDLKDDPYGYQVLWNGTSVVLRIRRWPAVDAQQPLRGLTIAVDPGHPPIGSTGPTGLYEGDATLMVAERLKAQLEARGARVFMTRTTRDAVPLNDRAPMARQQNVHAFVSVHLNALPDGANPFVNRGSGSYYYFAHSQPLATLVQKGLVARMGLRDEGVIYQNLAVARNPWFPAILCEGAYIMRPDHEAALRMPEFQEAYARGIAEGVEAYFRGRAGTR